MSLGTALEKAHPDQDAWYLQILGAHPRRGVGGKPVAHGPERARDDDAPCYLQTSDPANVAYYERFGFAVTTCH